VCAICVRVCASVGVCHVRAHVWSAVVSDMVYVVMVGGRQCAWCAWMCVRWWMVRACVDVKKIRIFRVWCISINGPRIFIVCCVVS
jgi:hypothetical protein